MTEAELAQREYYHLDNQHPNPWTSGSWYPATLTNGKKVDIKKTRGRGKHAGKHYLHIRRRVPRVIIHPDGTKEPFGTDWLHFRISCQDWSITEL